jgi:hypothetical protein
MMKHQGAHANNFQMWSTIFKHYEIIRVFPHFQTILSIFLLHAPLPTFRIASSSWHPESLSRRRPRRTLLFRMDIKQKRRFNPRTCFFLPKGFGILINIHLWDLSTCLEDDWSNYFEQRFLSFNATHMDMKNQRWIQPARNLSLTLSGIQARYIKNIQRT